MACSYYRVKHHENRRTLSRSATFRPGKFRARVDRVRSQELPVFACCRCRTPRQCRRENSRHKRYSHPVKSQLGVPTVRWLAAPTGLPPRTGSLWNASTSAENSLPFCAALYASRMVGPVCRTLKFRQSTVCEVIAVYITSCWCRCTVPSVLQENGHQKSIDHGMSANSDS